MNEVAIIGLDLAKNIFQAHAVGTDGSVIFRRKLSRAQLLKFMGEQPHCVVAMEVCASAHHWGRAIGDLGFDIRLIPPAYVKPFVRRQKNDMPDAEAIAEAASRPTMRFVAVKSEEIRDGRAHFSYKNHRSPEDWEVVLHDHHSAYIEWGPMNATRRNSRGMRFARPVGRSQPAVAERYSQGSCLVPNVGDVCTLSMRAERIVLSIGATILTCFWAKCGASHSAARGQRSSLLALFWKSSPRWPLRQRCRRKFI